MTNDIYEFDKVEHAHKLNGVELIGISSVVKDITSFGAAAYYGSRRALMELGYDPKDAPDALQSFVNEVNRIVALAPKEQKQALKNAYLAHAIDPTAT